MLWLAVHAPRLSLEAFEATLPAAPGDAARPVALLAGHRIEIVNDAARRLGVQPGQRRATALALAADLVLGQADAARDAAALRAIAHAALGFTPAVTLEPPHTVLLEVRASLRCFGGLQALVRRLRAALAPLGHGLSLATAPTPLGAALLARRPDAVDPRARGAASRDRVAAGDDGAAGDLIDGPHLVQPAAFEARLGALPVWLLGPGREHWETLQGMGLRTLADLRALPRAGLARRFGEGLLDDLDRALGQRADPRQRVAAPEAFDERLELFARADTTAQVLAGAQRLLARLAAWASARQSRIAAFTLRMHHEPRHRADASVPPATELVIALAEPAADAAHLQVLLRERLARCALPAPTLELQIRCRDTVAGAAPNGELFPSRRGSAEGLGRLLERLRARLGDDGVLRPAPRADHRPELAAALVPAGTMRAASAAQGGVPAPPGWPLHRPVWLIAEPQPLAERAGLPLLDGHALRLLAGPERIEAGWWDEALVARDYFVAQGDDGSLVWVYRLRLPQDGPGGWWLHGRFG